MAQFKDLIGVTLKAVIGSVGEEEITFCFEGGASGRCISRAPHGRVD